MGTPVLGEAGKESERLAACGLRSPGQGTPVPVPRAAGFALAADPPRRPAMVLTRDLRLLPYLCHSLA